MQGLSRSRRARAAAVLACSLAVPALATRVESWDGSARAHAMTDARDFAHLWWAHGFRGRSPDGRRLLCVRTGWYGFAIDVERIDHVNLGQLRGGSYAAAVGETNAAVLDLPERRLEVSVVVGTTIYRCVGAARDTRDWITYPVRWIEVGRFCARYDIQQLEFADDHGRRLNVSGRLEVVALSDRLSLLLEITPGEPLEGARAVLRMEGAEPTATPASAGWPAGEPQVAAVSRRFGPVAEGNASMVTATDLGAAGAPLAVTEDPVRGWVRVALPPGAWREDRDFDHLDRYPLVLRNPASDARVVRLLFARDVASPGITGMVPMLRDANGSPTGIPVQLSKNWHRQPDRRLLYDGPWFHGLSVLRLPPRSETRLELTIAYARWGGVPSASHAQLCLVGYGGNQQWDQAAVGSWGESICYDPDVNLNRSMIDDIRPLMVTAMQSVDGRWRWTNNVGGGDFLVLTGTDGRLRPLTRMRTAYLAHGPNLTDVVYAGTAADGAIEARIEVATPRTDDINRAYHRVRYDVRKPIAFTRLAFYQLGADRYNDHTFGKMAHGNADGLTEEWTIEGGGRRYVRQAIPLAGAAPWVSLHRAVNGDPRGGAWACRGLIVRRWRARLGGKPVATPFLASYGTQDGIASANAELAPPPGLSELLPGDFVEADVELVILPTEARDYYGPNEALRAALRAHADTWRMVHREAVGNQLTVRALRGTIVGTSPLEIRSRDGRTADIEVRGGLGYVPVSISGIWSPTGWRLEWSAGDGWSELSQSVHGGDWWQVKCDEAGRGYIVTVNVPVAVLGAGRPLRLRMVAAEGLR